MLRWCGRVESWRALSQPFIVVNTTRLFAPRSKPHHPTFILCAPGALAHFCRMLQFVLASRLAAALALLNGSTPGGEGAELYCRERPQFAVYPGNGTGYQKHVDNPRHLASSGKAARADDRSTRKATAGVDNGRRITVLYYLNPSWKSNAGGSLQLHNTRHSIASPPHCPPYGKLLARHSKRPLPPSGRPLQSPCRDRAAVQQSCVLLV